LIGTKLAHFLILEPLGAGGMGVVYRARDERLERDVAIKVLPAGALANEAARKQFRKEALSLSRLNHPNIETVHAFDSQDGVDFLVLELVPGETLSDLVRKAPLPEGETVRLGAQLCDGLAAAHHAGILHRDIKPANLRVTPDRRLKILDFGLAKFSRTATDLASTESVSASDRAVGTLPYMPPEQLQAGLVDARSDVYAAGAVLYEIACGRRAFPQQDATSVIAAILAQPPVSPRSINGELSRDLERIILRCMEKDPARRYQSAEELRSDLRQLVLPESRRSLADNWNRRSALRKLAYPAAALLLAVGLSIGFNALGLRERFFGMPTIATQSLAVLPLVNLSGDPQQEYFADGMTDELITLLAQVGALRVISRSSAMQYKGTKKPLREIARQLHVGVVVEGSVIRSGNRVRISARLIDPMKDQHLWAESYERSLSNVLALQSDVARAIVQSVRVRVSPVERGRLTNRRVVNPDAHEAYLRAQTEYNRFTTESLMKARDLYRRAIAIDPGYASAHAGLAQTFCLLSNLVLPPRDAMSQAKASALLAVQLDSTLARGYSALGYVHAFYEWNWQQAEPELKKTLELNPGSAEAHQNYGYFLLVNGRFNEALEELRKARELDPLSSSIATQTIFPLYEGRRYAKAITAAGELLKLDPGLWNVHMVLGQALLKQGDIRTGISEMEEARRLDENTITLGWLGYAYAMGGRTGDARKILDLMKNRPGVNYTAPYTLAVLYTGLGERDLAISTLTRGIEERSEDMVFLKVEPALDPLRSDPRFKDLLRRMGFPG
jgi:serine/threonine protein kinase/Flp pilus assembly protein TadD